MSADVLYVVNNDSTTSIPLEVAAEIKKNWPNIDPVVYYKESEFPSNNFIRDLIYIDAESILDFKAIKKSLHLIKQSKPGVIHAHHTISALIFFILSKFVQPSATLIKTVHTSYYSFRWDQKILNFFIYLMADKILCNSYATLNSFSKLEKYITRKKSKVVYNGVNQTVIRSNKNHKTGSKYIQKSENEWLIGSVGRMIEVKDFGTLIQAFAKLYKISEKNIRLILIGDGNEKKGLELLTNKLGLNDAVILTGAIERETVYSLLKQIDIFVITSLHEGFCNTLVEAMAAGKAIVCSDIPTLKEVASDAVLYSRVGSSTSFYKEIYKLLNDEQLFNKMKLKAENRSNKFTLKACAENYINEYS